MRTLPITHDELIAAADRATTDGMRDRLVSYLDSLAEALPSYAHPIRMARAYALARDPEASMRAYMASPVSSVAERAAIILAFEHVGWVL